VPSLHHPSFTKKNITTHARTIHSNAIHFRALYIYIYTHKKTFNASSFVFVGWSFVLLKETHRRSERRRKKSSTDDRKHAETSLRFCSKFTCIDFFARARFSLSRAALSREEEEEKKKKHKEEQRTTQKQPWSERRRRRRQRGKEERETTTSSSPLSRRATLGTKNCRFIFHLGFSN